MGTWSVPYEDVATAKLFAKVMAKPWIVAKHVDDDGEVTWSCRGIGMFVGDDGLFDEIDDRFSGRSFDVRTLVKKHVKRWITEGSR